MTAVLISLIQPTLQPSIALATAAFFWRLNAR